MSELLETAVSSAPVGFTTSALAEIKRLYLTEAANSGNVLRVGVKGGGCSGMTYILNFEQPGAGDTHYEYEGIPMVMNKAHGMYLVNVEVDFEDGLNARGFVFHNPNAKTTCGCGTSFSV